MAVRRFVANITVWAGQDKSAWSEVPLCTDDDSTVEVLSDIISESVIRVLRHALKDGLEARLILVVKPEE